MKIYQVEVDNPILEMIFDDYLQKHRTNVLPLDFVRD